MRHVTRFTRLALVLGLGLTAVVLALAGSMAAKAEGQVDLTIEINAPAHVAPGSTLVANLAYANIGTVDGANV